MGAPLVASPTLTPTGGVAFLSKSLIRILLVPTAHCSSDDFQACSSHLRNFQSIKLSDLPRKSRPTSQILSQQGEVHLSFVTSYDPTHSFLAPFDMSSQVLGVIAVGTCRESEDEHDLEVRESLERTPGELRDLHPGALVHRCFAFDLGEKGQRPMTMSSENSFNESLMEKEINARKEEGGSSSNAGGGAGFSGLTSTGLIIFPSRRKDGKDVKFYLKNLMSDFVSDVLEGLDQVVRGLENLPLETPRETLDGYSSNNNTTAKSGDYQQSFNSTSTLGTTAGNVASNAASRASALFSSFGSKDNPSQSNSPTASRPSSSTGSSSNTSASGSQDKRSSTLPSNKSTKRTNSQSGTGPLGLGRHSKLKADAALLSGDLWRALENYEMAMNCLGKERALAGGMDAVWYAGALEGWAQTRCLVERAGGALKDKAPSMDLPTGGVKEKDKKEKEKEKDFPDPPFFKASWYSISEAYSLAISIYSKCLAPPSVLLAPIRSVTNETPRDFTHPLIHAWASISYSRFLLSIWASSGWNGESFDQLLYGGIPPSLGEMETRPSKAYFIKLSKDSLVQRNDIALAASGALTYSSGVLKPPDQISVLSALASIYGCIGFNRREAYLLRQLQSCVVSLLGKVILSNPKSQEVTSRPLKFDQMDLESLDLTSKFALGTIVTQITTDTAQEGLDSVLLLANHVCETYAINLDLDPLRGVPSNHLLSRTSEGRKSSPNSPLLSRSGSSSWGLGGPLPRSSSNDALSSTQSKALDKNSLDFMLERSRSSFLEEADFGWKEQQIILLKDSICVSELIGDEISMVFFATILLRDYQDYLPAEEIWRLIQGIGKVSNSIRIKDASIGGQDLKVKYWGPEDLVRCLENVEMPDYAIPIERQAKELNPAIPKAAELETAAGTNNPFFWNPIGGSNSNSKSKSKSKSLVFIKGDLVEFFVTLQNPLEVALEIKEIKLSTLGSGFQATSVSTIIPPKSLQIVKLSGTPLESGSIQIRGCWVALLGCETKEFTVPLVEASTEKAKMEETSTVIDFKTRLKTWGLDSRPSVLHLKKRQLILEATDPESEIEPATRKKVLKPKVAERYLEGKIIDAQPLLSINSTSLNHGNLILLDGETKKLKVKLENTGNLDIDFLRIAFNDDLTSSTQVSLSEGKANLLAEDSHSLEWDLKNRPIFSLSHKSQSLLKEISIKPGESKICAILVRGKLDCENGKIKFEYGNVKGEGRGGSEIEESKNFCTREVELGIRFDVYPVVELSGIEVLPIGKKESRRLLEQELQEAKRDWKEKKRKEGIIKDVEDDKKQVEEPIDEKEEEESACLVCIDVRNVHSHPVELSLTLVRDDSRPLVLRRPLPSGSTSRFYLPTPLLSLPPSLTSSPIPSLTSRQFVVSRIKLSPKEEAMARKRFWYREHLMGKLNASWRELRTPERNGEVTGLREINLSDGMVEVLRSKDLDLELKIGGVEREGNEEKIKVEMEDFVNLNAKVTNKTSRPLRLFYRLVPLPFSCNSNSSNSSTSTPPTSDPSISNLLVTSGNLSGQVLPWPLQPGQSSSVEAGVCFLSRGDYKLVAICEESTIPSTSVAGLGDLEKKNGLGQTNEERIRVVQNEGLEVEVF